ncbi:hypothetical protein ACH492_35190 [Streptomyces sp. NPDC019443]|uniref:hypothetical protein n=1 Tax=Streptomyces sp. NPDC019443 TaxID=3365061 RepID=UPI00379B52CB
MAAAVVGTVVSAILTGWFQEAAPDLSRRALGSPALEVRFAADISDQTAPFALQKPVTTPQDRAMLVEPTSSREWQNFIREKNAAPVDRADMQIVLEGGRSKIRIVDLRPRILHKSTRWGGAYFIPATAGEVEAISVSADLDHPDPHFTQGKKGSRNYFHEKQLELARGEQVTLTISVTAKAAAYEFDFVATVIADGKIHDVPIRLPGKKPFLITARQAKPSGYSQVFKEQGEAWVQAPAAGRVWCKVVGDEKC